MRPTPAIIGVASALVLVAGVVLGRYSVFVADGRGDFSKPIAPVSVSHKQPDLPAAPIRNQQATGGDISRSPEPDSLDQSPAEPSLADRRQSVPPLERSSPASNRNSNLTPPNAAAFSSSKALPRVQDSRGITTSPLAQGGGQAPASTAGSSASLPGQNNPSPAAGQGGLAAASASQPPMDTAQTLSPSATGNSMSTADGKVAVEAVQPTPDGPNIDIAITPSGGTAAEQTSPGFTHEQELFRLKWGWENYDLALRATKEASRTSNP